MLISTEKGQLPDRKEKAKAHVEEWFGKDKVPLISFPFFLNYLKFMNLLKIKDDKRRESVQHFMTERHYGSINDEAQKYMYIPPFVLYIFDYLTL